MSPKVVIITPVKNLIQNKRDSYFQKLTESVQKQTYSNIEHFILSGVSTDNTDAFVQEYASS